MTILVDTREKEEKLQRILKQFERLKIHGYEFDIRRTKLSVGDYMIEGQPELVIDLKKDLNEVAHNLLNREDHARFWREISRARAEKTHLVILIEHSQYIKSIPDVVNWNSPYSNVTGRRLVDEMYRLHIAYGVDFAFCDKPKTARTIYEILTHTEVHYDKIKRRDERRKQKREARQAAGVPGDDGEIHNDRECGDAEGSQQEI